MKRIIAIESDDEEIVNLLADEFDKLLNMNPERDVTVTHYKEEN
jgi:cytoplasmic iron level regulating protein YaaA (DUF328/UPF0246 family)